jgi:putative SOS response-associated peptidase YedK
VRTFGTTLSRSSALALPRDPRRSHDLRDREGETTNDFFAFLTTEPNKVVGAIHPKAMPAILTTVEEIDTWMSAPTEEALKLQRPLADDALMIVARGEKKDEGGGAA